MEITMQKSESPDLFWGGVDGAFGYRQEKRK